MKRHQCITQLLLLLPALCLLLPGAHSVAEAADRVAELVPGPTQLNFVPQIANQGLTLSVAGPGGYRFDQRFEQGERISFSITTDAGEKLADGIYRYQLKARPVLAPEVIELLHEARAQGDNMALARLQNEGVIPRLSTLQSGAFTVCKGSFVNPNQPEVVAKDFEVWDDLLSTKACIGFDCLEDESFGNTTLKLKEHNLRMLFDDTSKPSYPDNDWQIIANSRYHDGADFFTIKDTTADNALFSIFSGAPPASLVINHYGRLGLGFSLPLVDVHIRGSDSPWIRLQQDDSSGWLEYTWAIAGNETNFYIRDSRYDKYPFRIKPGSIEDTLVIADNGVGLGTFRPGETLHLLSESGTAALWVEETSLEAGQRSLLTLSNRGSVRFDLSDKTTGVTWVFQNHEEAFGITAAGTGVRELELYDKGNLILQGTMTVRFDENDERTYPDYVFNPEHELRSLDELQAYIEEHGHLPKIPTVEDVRAGGLNMTEMQLKLLEKIEELTLYKLAQEETIRTRQVAYQASLARLSERIEVLEATHTGGSQ